MKFFILISFLTLTLIANEATYTKLTKALTRDEHFRLIEKDVPLTDLLTESCFYGKYFKIVFKKSDDPICFNEENKDLLLKAGTVYYNLMLARDYFINKMASQYVGNLKQIIVRLEITNQFDTKGHFKNDNLSPQYNNALTIPPGEGLTFGDYVVTPWGYEIWLRPGKEIKVSLGDKVSSQKLDNMFASVNDQFTQRNIIDFVAKLAMANEISSNVFLDAVEGALLFQGLLELTTWVAKGAVKWDLKRERTVFIDAAMIPEILYHEFSHVALSDTLNPYFSTAVNEGYANYFAVLIANHPKLGAKAKKYYVAKAMDANADYFYKSVFETPEYANMDFVLSIFWRLSDILGDKTLEIIYDARNQLKTESSNIRNGLIEAIIESTEKHSENPYVDKLKLYQFFNKMGF